MTAASQTTRFPKILLAIAVVAAAAVAAPSAVARSHWGVSISVPGLSVGYADGWRGGRGYVSAWGPSYGWGGYYAPYYAPAYRPYYPAYYGPVGDYAPAYPAYRPRVVYRRPVVVRPAYRPVVRSVGYYHAGY